MPAPLGPMRPMRSPRSTRAEKSRITTRSPNDLPTPSASNTSLPGDSACSIESRTVPARARRAAALGAHLEQPLHAPLVARAPRLDAAAQPRFFCRQRLVELVVGQRLVLEPLLFLAHEGGVVAWPGGQPAAIQLHDPGRQPLQERAVVGDQQHRAGVVGQESLHPFDRVDVQVVGRLVEEQHLGRCDQRARQQHPAAPAARQAVHGSIGRQLQPRQHHLDPLFQPPAVALFQLVLQPSHLVQRRGAAVCHLHRRVVVGRDQRAQPPQALGHHVEDTGWRIERDILIQPRAAKARRPPDGAPVGLQFSAGDAQQRGFAAAVAPNQRNAFAGLELQRDVIEQRHVAVGVADVVQAEQGHESLGYSQAPRLQAPGPRLGLETRA